MHAARRYADFHTHIHIRPKIHRLRFNMMEIQGFSKGITQTIKVWYGLISFKCVAPGGSHVALRGVPLVCLFLACRGFWGGACLCVPSYSLRSDFVGKTISPRVAGLQPQNLRRTLWRRSLTETLWKPNKDVQSYWFYTDTTQTAQATAGLPGHGSPLCKATWQQSKDLRVSCQVWALVNARYTWSLYFTLTTLTTVGYGHWAADRCYGHILVAVPCCSLLFLAVPCCWCPGDITPVWLSFRTAEMTIGHAKERGQVWTAVLHRLRTTEECRWVLLLLLTLAVIFSGLLGMLSDLVASVNKDWLPTWNGQVRGLIVDDLFGFYRVANIESCLKMHLQ